MAQRCFDAAIFVAALLAAAAPAYGRSVTVENNCEEGPRCLRVYNEITKIEFCLDPDQSYEVKGLADGATYCAWCADEPPPEDCRQFPVRFD